MAGVAAAITSVEGLEGVASGRHDILPWHDVQGTPHSQLIMQARHDHGGCMLRPGPWAVFRSVGFFGSERVRSAPV